MRVSFQKFIRLFIYLQLLTVMSANAQYYLTGEEPFSIKWKQINTANFQIIFPEGTDSIAQYVANKLEIVYEIGSNSLEHRPKKISVILHAHTFKSNGYVSWAPKRMEFYLTPPQDMYPQDWLDQLCVHEFRHVVQVDKLQQGMTKYLSWILGQQAVGLSAGMLPMWYLEGDAVATETALTDQGRGRQPGFENQVKAHLLSDEKRYSYDQVNFGSYQHFVPSHYHYGYLLNAYTRQKYGQLTWSRVENRVGRFPFTIVPSPFPFNRAVKKETGLRTQALYDSTINYLSSRWSKETPKKKPELWASSQSEKWESYEDLEYMAEDTLIAIRRSLDDITEFVKISQYNQEVVFKTANLSSTDFSYARNYIIWAERKRDIRWPNREYSILRMRNIRTNKAYIFPKKTRLVAPDFSEDVNYIAAVEITENQKSYITILHTARQQIIKRIPVPDMAYAIRPEWFPGETKLAVILLKNNEKHIYTLEWETGKWTQLFSAGKSDIKRLSPRSEAIYFISNQHQNNEVYKINLKNKTVFKVTSSRLGTESFALNENEGDLYTNEYTSQGHKPRHNNLKNTPITRIKWNSETIDLTFSEELSKSEQQLTAKNKSKIFETKPYRKLAHIFNAHSWFPFYFDYNAIDEVNYNNLDALKLAPGFNLLSQNKLGTTVSNLGYGYLNGFHQFNTSITYRGFYPVFKIAYTQGSYPETHSIKDNDWFPETQPDNKVLNMEAYLPFQSSYQSAYYGFQPRIRFRYQKNYYYNYEKDYYLRGLNSLDYQLLFYTHRYQAHRDLQPKWGITVFANYTTTPFSDNILGSIGYGYGQVYFPGFFKHDGFRVLAGYQQQEPDLYIYSSSLPFPRGYDPKRTEELYILKADYRFPIAYPDWSLGPVVYMKRIKAGIFGDIARNQYKFLDESTGRILIAKEFPFSTGIELTADFHLLRTIYPLEAGIRYNYIPEYNKHSFDFVFNININELYSLRKGFY